MNAFLDDMKTGGRSSVIGNWMNRRQGFERLEQYSDGENEPLDTQVADDSNNNSGDESIMTTTKQQGSVLNNKSTTATYNMGDSL